MKTYLHFLIEAAEKEIEDFKTNIANQMLNRDKGQSSADKIEYSEKSPDPNVVTYIDNESENIKKKIEELETQKQNIQKKIEAIEDMLVDQTIDPGNKETMNKIEDLKIKLNQDIEKFDNLINIEQDKQDLLKNKK